MKATTRTLVALAVLASAPFFSSCLTRKESYTDSKGHQVQITGRTLDPDAVQTAATAAEKGVEIYGKIKAAKAAK